jgi:hypothetical protein
MYNNLLLNKYVQLNNKISKFNKKHLIEFVMPKSKYQLRDTSKYTIKNCAIKPNKDLDKDLVTDFNPLSTFGTSLNCNENCELNFYRSVDWA